MNICVIIPAAGRSLRYGQGDKLAQDLGGRSVLVRTVELFTKREEVRSILVAGSPDSFQEFREKYGPTLGFHGAQVVEGGRDHRWQTVQNAMKSVPDDATHIAVHDAARPNVTKEVFDRLFKAAEQFDAVIPVVPVNATVKRISDDAESVTETDVLADRILGETSRVKIEARKVMETIDRSGLAEVQTPQVFKADLLKRAYSQPSIENVTDDAELVERLGETVHAIEGDVRNVKITTPADLHLMCAILGVKAPAERPVHKRF